MSHENLRTPVRFGLVLLLVLAVMVIPAMAGTDNSSVPDTSVTGAEPVLAGTAPVAGFTADIPTGPAPLIVRFTDTSANAPTLWAWDFGDGTLSTEESPAHTYTTTGSFTVTLTVTNDSDSDSNKKTDFITVTSSGSGDTPAPVATFTTDVTSGIAPLTVSNTGGNNSEIKTASIKLSEEPVVAPVADFTASTTSGTVPMFVRFTDASTGVPTGWTWDFGDGTSSTTQNATHTYTTAGNYTVNLTATNAADSDSEVKTSYITASVGSGGLANSAWPKDRFDRNNTGQSPYVGSQSNTTKWTFSVGSFRYGCPVIGPDGTIYVGDYAKNFSAINPDGTMKWSYTTGGQIYGSAAIATDGTTYIGNYGDKNVYAINPDGTMKWSYTTGGQIYGSPAITTDGTIYIGNYGDYNLYALNPDGTLKWSYTTGGRIYGSPAIGADGTIYTASYDKKVYALNPDGTLKWSYTTGGYIYSSPAIATDGTIYIGNYGDKKVYAFNPDGTLKWSYTTGGQIQGSAAIATDGTIYIGNYGDKIVYAFNPDGTLKWSYTTGGRIYGSPAIGADGTIYTGNYDKKIYALNPDGTLKWSYTTGGYIYGSPAIATDGTVYAGSYDGKISAFSGVVDYTTQQTSSGSNPTLQFTGISPLSVTSWYWNFGDGTTSTGQTPSHSYPSIGTYTVNLTIEHPYGTNTVTRPVIVYNPPVAAFTSGNPSGKVPLTVIFTDASTDSPTSWTWDFGDGSNSTLQSPTHTYITAGTYTVNLTATNAAGSNTSSLSGYVRTSPAIVPTAAFSTDVNSGTEPLAVNFSDASSDAPASWLWDFGDGTTSTLQNPVHWYAAGTYTINFTATNLAGSNSTIKTEYITVASNGLINQVVNPGFETGDLSGWTQVENPVNSGISSSIVHTGNHSLRMGLGTLTSVPYVEQYIDLTNTTAISFWYYFNNDKYGRYVEINIDGTRVGYTELYPQYSWVQYKMPISVYTGVHKVTIWYLSQGTTAETYLDDIVVMPAPIASFTAAPATTGIAPLTVQFNDTSTRLPASWSWNFGDGATSTEQHPAHTYTTAGTYTVILTATNDGGSNTSAKTGYITVIDKPITAFSVNTTSGSVPFTVLFTDKSTNSPTSWLWDFGDCSTSTVQNATHTFVTSGNFTVNLTATNVAGSNSTAKTGYISVTAAAVKPVAAFTADKITGNAPVTITFTDASTNWPTAWTWDFGDGNSTNATVQNPVHTYSSVGTYTVSLTATNAGGSNTSSRTGYITILNLQILSNYHFINLYVANDEGVKYDVPNGAAASGGTYNYVNNTYWVMFRQAGGGLNPMHISGKSNAWTAADLTSTTNQSGSFFITFSGGQPSMPDGILMLAVNGTVPDDFRVHIRSSGQDFDVGTPGTGNQGLPAASTFLDGAVDQTFEKKDFLYGPQSWRPSSSAGYPVYNGEVQADPANQFQLMFIDLKVGALQNASLPNNGMIKVEYEFTNLSSVAVFNIYGWYMQCNHGTGIIMTNQADLSGYMVTPPVKTITPIASFTSDLQTGPAPLTVAFTDMSANTPTSWLWDFGDGSSTNATVQNPVHTYASAGTYTVNLTATNGKGTNTITRLGYITVTAPLPNYNNIFVSVANEAGVKYNAFSNNTYYVSFKGANSGLNALHISTDPSVNYGQVTTTGNHDGTFYVTDSGGKGYEDEIILLVAVNGTIPENFTLNVKADGYNWTPNPVSNTAPSLDNVTYQSVALNETFTKSDFIYGPQIWKPTADGYTYPIYYGQNMSEPGNTFQLMFIDLNAGVLRPNTALMNQGAVRINYSLQNLGSVAVFNVYAYCKNSNNGNDMVAWTNALTSAQSSGYLVTNGYIPAPVANFTANMTSGTMPLTVQFTDASTNTPTSWLWDFGDNATAITQNATHTYTTAGAYTVNLTVTNAAGTNSLVRDRYISVRNASADLAQLILPAASLYQDTATQLPVMVTNITRGTGISFNLAYDPAVIRVNEITLNQSYASGGSLTMNVTSGLIRLSLTSTEGITIGSPVPVFFLNTTSTGAVGSQTPLTLTSAMWSDTTFNKRQLDTVNGSALVYRIRGDLNGNGWVDIGDTAKTAYMVVQKTPDLIPDADFNNNGRIDVGDATKIACYLVGKITEL